MLFGSPGLGTWDRDDLNVPDGHLFVAEADDDPVADLGGTFGVDPSHMDGVDFLSSRRSPTIDGERFQRTRVPPGHIAVHLDGDGSHQPAQPSARHLAGDAGAGRSTDDGRGAGDVLTGGGRSG